MIASSLKLCPEQDSNLHVSQHSHLKRARLPFRHLGFSWCKITAIFSFHQIFAQLFFLPRRNTCFSACLHGRQLCSSLYILDHMLQIP